MIIADYPLRGTWRDEPPLRLGELQQNQIAQLLDSSPRRACDPSLYPEGRWRALMAEGACLRVIDGSTLCSVEADYFDQYLLERCPSDWVKAHRVAGDAMFDISNAGHSIDSAFLFWRLRELIQKGKMLSDGNLPVFGGGPSDAVSLRR